MEECIFCKIVSGKIPCAKVYDDGNVICFLDIMPANKGHCLIVPKIHYETLLDAPEEILSEMMTATKKVARALSLSVGNGSYNLLMNNGKVAGQIVMHAHFHLVPRFDGDRLRLKWSHKKYENDEIKDYAEKIRKFV